MERWTAKANSRGKPGRWSWLAVVCSLLSARAWAVCSEIDAVSSGITLTDTLTIQHTTSGTNRLMLVAVSIDNNNSEVVTSLTYNGLPSGGPFDVDITFDDDLAEAAIVGVVTFTDVDPTTPVDSVFGNQATSGTASVTVSWSLGSSDHWAAASAISVSGTASIRPSNTSRAAFRSITRFRDARSRIARRQKNWRFSMPSMAHRSCRMQ